MPNDDDGDALSDFVRKLMSDPSVRLNDAGSLSPRLVTVCNELAADYERLRHEHDLLRSDALGDLTRTLLEAASGSFGHRAARSYDGEALDVLAFLVNATADELQELVGRLAREQAQRAATQAQLIASEKEAALGRLASGVAHEINQPMTVIMTLVERLQSKVDAPAEARAQWLQLIADAADQVAKIVDGVRTFGRPTPFALRDTAPVEPLDKAIALVSGHLQASGIQLIRVHPTTLPKVKANAERLQQVFTNLLTNAHDALVGDGTFEPAIEVEIQVRGNAVAYVFRDNGPGVPERLREQIFEPFFTTKDEGGTGLGLSVSQGILRDHGGRLLFEPRSPHGSVFTALVPLGEVS